jgi:glycosyltransferase involved in cell wall biosynthesis
MDIFYILNSRFPTIKAYGLQVAKTCESFEKNGVHVTLVIPSRRTHREIKNIPTYKLYGISTPFPIVALPSLDFSAWHLDNKILFIIQQILFAIPASLYVLFKNGVIYSRDPFSLYLLSFTNKKFFWEIHNLSDALSMMHHRIIRRATGIVVISDGLRKKLIAQGISSQHILIAHDGIDMDEFDSVKTSQDARRELDLPLDKKIVMYVGHLFKWKGVETLLEAARTLSSDIVVIIVGGTASDINRFQNENPKVLFVGFKEHRLIPIYMRAADVLVLPNKKDAGISEFYTSPLKLFEYMAAGKPIVASDLASLREILNENNAYFFDSESSQSLSKKIMSLLNDPEATKKGKQAKSDVRRYTWTERGRIITAFLQQNHDAS